MKEMHKGDDMEDCLKIDFSEEEFLCFYDLSVTWDHLKHPSTMMLIFIFMSDDINELICDRWIDELNKIFRTSNFTKSFLEVDKNINEVFSTISHALDEKIGREDDYEIEETKAYFKYDICVEDRYTIFIPLKYVPYIKKALELMENIQEFVFEDCIKSIRFMYEKCDEDKIKHCCEMLNKHHYKKDNCYEERINMWKRKFGGYLQ